MAWTLGAVPAALVLIVEARGAAAPQRADGRGPSEVARRSQCLFWSRLSGSLRFLMSRFSKSQGIEVSTQQTRA